MSLIEAYGGARWRPAAEAVAFIVSHKDCSEDEAAEALRVWIHDGHVPFRTLSGRPGITITEHVVSLIVSHVSPGSGLARLGALGYFEIDMIELRRWLDSSQKTLSRSRSPVSGEDLASFLNGTASKNLTKEKLRALAKKHFGHVPWRVFDQAWTALPGQQKRLPGETDRAIQRKK